MYHSGIHPAQRHHHIHLPEHSLFILLVLGMLALIGILIYMTRTNMPTDIEFRPLYFPGPLVIN